MNLHLETLSQAVSRAQYNYTAGGITVRLSLCRLYAYTKVTQLSGYFNALSGVLFSDRCGPASLLTLSTPPCGLVVRPAHALGVRRLCASFGAALWGVDWNTYLASQNLTRSHMHQGTNYR